MASAQRVGDKPNVKCTKSVKKRGFSRSNAQQHLSPSKACCSSEQHREVLHREYSSSLSFGEDCLSPNSQDEGGHGLRKDNSDVSVFASQSSSDSHIRNRSHSY